MSSKSRNKGGKWERDLKKLFEEYTEVTWERVRGSGAFDKKGDIYPAYDSFPFIIEAKHTENWNFHDFLSCKGIILNTWWPKICEECKLAGNRLPMLICKRNYIPPIICLNKAGVKKLKISNTVDRFIYKNKLYIFRLEDVIKKSQGKHLILR